MKKIFSILAIAFFACTTIMAQGIKEPDFVGEVVVINPDSTTTKLISEKATLKTKSGLGSMVPVVGAIKSYMIVKGAASSVVVSAKNNPIQFIVRSDGNEKDPTSIMSIVKFEVKKKERRAYMGKTSLISGSDVGLPESLPFTGEKFGESSYKLTANLEPGEYGIMVGGQEEGTFFMEYRCFRVE